MRSSEDAISEIFFGFFAVLVMIFVPLMLFGFYQTKSTETAAREYIEDFVEDARATGFFSSADFEILANQIGSFDLLFDMEIYHYSQRAVPDGNGGYILYDYVYDYNDIVEELYGAGLNEVTYYKMAKGDELDVRIVSKSEYPGMNFVKVFLPASRKIINIHKAEQIDNNPDR